MIALQCLLIGAHAQGTRKERENLRQWLVAMSKAEGVALSSKAPLLATWPEGLTEQLIVQGEALIDSFNKQGIGWITCIDKDYPKRLFLLPDFPLALLFEGDRSLLKAEKVSVVGTRQPSCDGEAMCRLLGAYLSRCKVTAVSGLAFGIDAAIHRGILRHGGNTIAILPSGLRAIAPKSHLRLSEEILERGGLLLSERLPTAFPLQHHYLERNRLIAALSEKVVIVESGSRGGSLNTAMHAVQIGCEVYAMPGAIRNPVAVGTNRLIRDGALPLTAPEDLCLCRSSENRDSDEIGNVNALSLKGKGDELLPEGMRGRLISVLKEGGVWTPDRLSERLAEPIYVLLPELMALVLDGRAEQLGDGYHYST